MLATTPRLTLLGALLVLPCLLPAQIVPPLPKNPLGRPKPAATNAETPPAATPRPYAGTFVGEDLVLELAWNDTRSRYEGTVVHEGERMPCQGNVRGEGFAGTFVSEGEEFSFTMQLVGDKATVQSDGETYVLKRRGGTPAPTPAPQSGNGNAVNGGGDAAPAPAALGDFPAWLRPGARVTYFAGTATLPGVSTQLIPDENGGWRDGNGRTYREDQVPSTGGGGLTQYDFVNVAPDCVAATMTIHTYIDAGLQTTTQTGITPLVGDQNGFTDLWVPPAKLRAMAEQQGGGLTVRRVKYPLNGRTFDALVTQTKSDSGYQRYTYDMETGLMLVFSASSTSANVATRVGSTIQQGAGGTTITSVVLKNLRMVSLPWAAQGAPQWLQSGKRLDYAGTYQNSLTEGTMAPWRYGMSIQVTEVRGACAATKLQTQIDYGTGAGPQTTDGQAIYGPASFGNIYLDARTLQRLQRGQELDRDPVTGRRLVFVGSDARTATILEQGPVDQQSYTFDLQSGVLLATSQRQQQGPAVIRIDLQLQQR